MSDVRLTNLALPSVLVQETSVGTEAHAHRASGARRQPGIVSGAGTREAVRVGGSKAEMGAVVPRFRAGIGDWQNKICNQFKLSADLRVHS